MAGNCVNSAAEVGEALGSACVGYVVAVYRDSKREVRNHIAAVGREDGRDQVVDVTWKQFPFLLDPQVDIKSEPLILVCTLDEWTDMISRYTPGIANLLISQETTLEAAREWMRDNRRTIPQVTSAPAKGSTRGCTLF